MNSFRLKATLCSGWVWITVLLSYCMKVDAKENHIIPRTKSVFFVYPSDVQAASYSTPSNTVTSVLPNISAINYLRSDVKEDRTLRNYISRRKEVTPPAYDRAFHRRRRRRRRGPKKTKKAVKKPELTKEQEQKAQHMHYHHYYHIHNDYYHPQEHHSVKEWKPDWSHQSQGPDLKNDWSHNRPVHVGTMGKSYISTHGYDYTPSSSQQNQHFALYSHPHDDIFHHHPIQYDDDPRIIPQQYGPHNRGRKVFHHQPPPQSQRGKFRNDIKPYNPYPYPPPNYKRMTQQNSLPHTLPSPTASSQQLLESPTIVRNVVYAPNQHHQQQLQQQSQQLQQQSQQSQQSQVFAPNYRVPYPDNKQTPEKINAPVNYRQQTIPNQPYAPVGKPIVFPQQQQQQVQATQQTLNRYQYNPMYAKPIPIPNVERNHHPHPQPAPIPYPNHIHYTIQHPRPIHTVAQSKDFRLLHEPLKHAGSPHQQFAHKPYIPAVPFNNRVPISRDYAQSLPHETYNGEKVIQSSEGPQLQSKYVTSPPSYTFNKPSSYSQHFQLNNKENYNYPLVEESKNPLSETSVLSTPQSPLLSSPEFENPQSTISVINKSYNSNDLFLRNNVANSDSLSPTSEATVTTEKPNIQIRARQRARRKKYRPSTYKEATKTTSVGYGSESSSPATDLTEGESTQRVTQHKPYRSNYRTATAVESDYSASKPVTSSAAGHDVDPNESEVRNIETLLTNTYHHDSSKLLSNYRRSLHDTQ